jgi:hypothetical protein
MNTNVFELTHTSALSGNLNQMAIDKNGQIWAGGPDGIRRINPTMWYSTSIGPIESEVWAVAIDKQDNKWFGHEYGVLKYDNQTWTPYNPVNSGIIDKFTFSIAVDSVGNIWFGTRGGLSMLSGQNSGIKRNFDLHKKTISSYFLHASFVTKDRFLISSNLNLKTINIYDLNGKCLLRSGIQNYNRSSQIISIENIHSCFHGKMLILEVNDNKNNILRTKLNYFY